MNLSQTGSQALDTNLDSGFTGEIVQAGDKDYEDVRRVHNGLINRHPGLILRCRSTADVLSALKLGLDEELEIAVRGGGHNVGGRAVCDDGLVIDLSLMKVKIKKILNGLVKPMMRSHPIWMQGFTVTTCLMMNQKHALSPRSVTIIPAYKKIKKEFDPDNIFRGNQNITPA